MTADERSHTLLGSVLLWFSYDLCLEILPFPEAFFALEHPAPPQQAEERDIPSSWLTGACALLESHPDVYCLDLMQGKFGAKSPKPTRLLCKGLHELPHFLRVYGDCPMPKALEMKQVDGMFSTAELKAYPEKFCRALSSAIRSSLELFQQSAPACTCVDRRTEEWIATIQQNANLSAGMGMDRAGNCDL